MVIASTLNVVSHLDGNLGILSKVITALASCLVLWRIWRFTILPTFLSTEPKELPYWMPFIGHAIALSTNSEALLRYARWQCPNLKLAYFRNYRESY